MLPELRLIRLYLKNMMMKKNKIMKIVVSSTATIFLVILYCFIFRFSEQDGETSGGFSLMISAKCMEIWNALARKNWSEVIIQKWAVYFEHPIRKIAHLCEYAVMEALLFCIWYPWIGLYGKNAGIKDDKNKKRLYKRIPLLVKIVIPWVFVSAIFDEIHQLFVPERYGSFADVLLDTLGGCMGLICCIYGVKILNHLQMRRKKK